MRRNNSTIAEQYLLQAREICPGDPLVYNELGVLRYRAGMYVHCRAVTGLID